MTINELMTILFQRYEKNVDIPDTTSEDFLVRLNYVNGAIRKWESETGMDWQELFATLPGTLDASGKMVLTNFKRPAGFLKIGNDFYSYVRPERVMLETTQRPGKKIYSVINKTLYAYPNPGAVAFTLDYRKKALTYVTGLETAEIEMGEPEFALNLALAQLYLDDDNGTEASVKMQLANELMESMQLANELTPFFQDNKNDDSPGLGY